MVVVLLFLFVDVYRNIGPFDGHFSDELIFFVNT